MHDAPLGLPKGSVRAIIAIISLIAVIVGSIGYQNVALGEIFKPILAIIVAFYFASRMKESGGK